MPRGNRRGRNRVIQEVTLRPNFVDTHRIFGFQDSFGPGPSKSALRSDRPTKSKFIDAFDMLNAYSGVREKHTRMTFDLLRRMAATCEPMAAIVHLRTNQAASFAKLPRYESDTGFKITTRDPDQKVRTAESKEIQRLQDFLLQTGFEPSTNRRDNFDMFLRKIVRDSLVLDAYAVELVPGRNAKKHPVREVWAVDAATIRFADESRYQVQIYDEDAGDIAYIQEIDGRVVAEYTTEELAYGIRNPSTQVESNGYGCSELEEGINLITSILLAEQFNRAYFSNNSTPRGFISLHGNYNDEQLDAFKRAWRQQLEGAANNWRVPVMAFDEEGEMKWNPLDLQSSRDMEYHLWLDYLTNVLCALYCVNPAELGLKGYQPQGQPLGAGTGGQKEQLDQGEDKGLLPLMTNIGNLLNSQVVWKLNDEFVIDWRGLGSDDKLQQQQYFVGYLNAGVMTVNEVRDNIDMPPIQEEWADAPANATLAGVYTQGKQQEMMAQQPGPATAGGPMLPPNNQLGGAPGDKPGEGEKGPQPPQPQQPGQPGQPPRPPLPPAPKPTVPAPGGGAPKPFGKSLAEPTEIVIEFEE